MTRSIDWNRLARQALERARKTNDPRQRMLQEALQQGKTDRVLRRLSIICSGDLDREFPLGKTV
jgi:hypothetical protein